MYTEFDFFYETGNFKKDWKFARVTSLNLRDKISYHVVTSFFKINTRYVYLIFNDFYFFFIFTIRLNNAE